MNNKKILIVSDAENQHYWSALTNESKKKNVPMRISFDKVLLDKDISWRKIDHPYDVIVIDISNIEDLRMLVPEINHEYPDSRIIIVSSTPTWKQTREVIRLGASNLIRKSSDLDEVIDELQLL